MLWLFSLAWHEYQLKKYVSIEAHLKLCCLVSHDNNWLIELTWESSYDYWVMLFLFQMF